MFRSARLKLTAWYLLSIMAISIIFSVFAYRGLVLELDNDLQFQAMQNRIQERLLQGSGPLPIPRLGPGGPAPGGRGPGRSELDLKLLAEAKRRVALRLFEINIGVFVLACGAGYLLAGRTLKPIEQMVDEQKQFVSDASHELRTPLTAMRTEIEVALREKHLDQADTRGVLESNLEEITKLQNLSDNLLTLGRFQTITNKENFTKTGLANLIRDAVQRVGPLASEKNIEITSDIDDVELEGDRESLTNLFVIFLDNAIKYSNGGRLINVRTSPLKNKTAVHVQDFGVGIMADDLPHIFNRFYRADAARTTTGATGYGLGLSIAKDIVDLHRGRIDVESTPGEGTTFTITLPHAN